MAITRLGQLTADMQFVGDIITLSASPPTISNAKYHTGGFSHRIDSSVGPFGFAIATVDHVRTGFWLNHVGSSDEAVIFHWVAVDLTTCKVVWNSGLSRLELYVDGIVEDFISDTSFNFSVHNVWLHCGLVVISGTSISFYVSGERALHYEGSAMGADVAEFYVAGNIGGVGWQGVTYVDDFYLDEITSGEIDIGPPPKRFMFSLPNAAGVDEEFTAVGIVLSNYQAVDDAGAPDGDDTYNRAFSPNLKDTFNTADIELPSDYVIRAVIPTAIAKRTDSLADYTLRLHTFNGVTYETSGKKSLLTTYQSVWDRQPLQPDDATWNEEDFGDHQYGYQSDDTS